MARPNKYGLDYFSFDVDFFEDEKIEAIFVEFGIKGEIAVVKLLCTIYRNGYFIKLNDSVKIKLLKSLPGISYSLLDRIIKQLIKWRFFNEELFNKYQILTSSGIQNRFFSATKRRNKNEEYPYLLIDIHNERKPPKEENKELYISNEKESVNLSFVLDKTLIECYNELSNNKIWIETLVMNTRNSGYRDFTIYACQTYIKRFFEKLQNEGETKKSIKDSMAHFSRWLNIELIKNKNHANNRNCYTSKQEANDYAMQQYLDDRALIEQGVVDKSPKPF